MAARLRKTHQDDVREKIQASQIINRLQACLDGNVELSSVQMKAAEILLRKTLPDLSSVELGGEGGGPIQIVASSLDEKL